MITGSTIENVKSCHIIYGYQENCLPDSPDSPIILIEPRTDVIDMVRSMIKTNTCYRNTVILVSKALNDSSNMSETILYYDKQSEKFWLDKTSRGLSTEICVNGTNLFNVKKYNVYTTSVNNLIVQYSIQNIKSFTININVTNCDQILRSIIPFNHLISQLRFFKKVGFNTIDDLFANYTTSDRLVENKALDHMEFVHKNLTVDLPNIGLYFINTLECKSRRSEIALLLNQYKMNLIVNDTLDKFDSGIDSYIVKYPESVTIINRDISYKVPNSKIYYENVIQNLDFIFDREKGPVDLDIVIQFNPRYFASSRTLQIMYPLKDNTIYINKMFDIIYATKNCMYMLYQILKSRYFTEYIEDRKNEKPSLFKIFSKRYFYEYIGKIFILKDFT